MSRVVSVSLQKGGAGKTAIAINLADALVARGNSALLVDLDQQGNMTGGVGLKDDYESLEPNIGDVLTDNDPIDVREVIRDCEGFDVLPSHVDLDGIEDRVRNLTFGTLWVRRQIVDPFLGDNYDYVVIDSPPSSGPLSDMALIGTGNVVVPLLMGEPGVSGFERTFEQQIGPIHREVDLDILVTVPNDLTGNNEEKRIIRNLEDLPFEQFTLPSARSDLFDDLDSKEPGIRHRIALSRAWRGGKTLREYDPLNDMPNRPDRLAEVVGHGGTDDA